MAPEDFDWAITIHSLIVTLQKAYLTPIIRRLFKTVAASYRPVESSSRITRRSVFSFKGSTSILERSAWLINV